MAESNYFTCTLGEAARRRQNGTDSHQAFKTVIHMIDQQALKHPETPCLGFANFKRTETTSPTCITFKQLHDLSLASAKLFFINSDTINTSGVKESIALLCASSLEFVFTWLGLMRLGHSVILLAPQLESNAIEHLCRELKVTKVYADDKNYKRRDSLTALDFLRVPSISEVFALSSKNNPHTYGPISDVAYFCHTSGTSSGLPKPIPQSQAGVVGVLPQFLEPGQPATFSTTPLYHGGLVDCFRAWSSSAMIWFFPEGIAPITSASLRDAIAFAQRKSNGTVEYFSAVPFVIQLLAEKPEGVELLASMSLVGVGGAALPVSTGDKLIQAGVRLLSRLGSAECGFLMSSHRQYANDTEWQYLFHLDHPRMLDLEARDDGLSELVVGPDWPFKAKTNRRDGSYCTSDLFEPHSRLPNRWRYHSRADAQITLINGKKFDPSPIEANLASAVPSISDAFIFGAGKEYAGALLFVKDKETPELQVIEMVWPVLASMNESTQSHARIAKLMLKVVVVKPGEEPLVKSSKGTIRRSLAEKRYEKEIESAYQDATPDETTQMVVRDDELRSAVSDCFLDVLGRPIDVDGDIYQQGVDSLSASQIRKRLNYLLLPGVDSLPLNIVYEKGTILEIESYIRSINHGITDKPSRDIASVEMQELVEKFSVFDDEVSPVHRQGVKGSNTYVLTGATGMLGASILDRILGEVETRKVICLVRASSSAEAERRVVQTLHGYHYPVNNTERLVCIPYNLSAPNLGLSDLVLEQVLSESTTFIQSAWPVNFNLRLKSFEDQIAGTRTLLSMAYKASADFYFISSTAAVACSKEVPIQEAVSYTTLDASPLGYSQSKWVAEQICAKAASHFAENASGSSLRAPRISILRVGQLCGNESGHWNQSEAYPSMLSTAKITRVLPDLEGESLSWLPVDVASRAILQCIHYSKQDGHGENLRDGKAKVIHILNPHSSPSWSDLLQWISQTPDGQNIEAVSPHEWVDKLQDTLAGLDHDHPSQRLLGFWKQRFQPTLAEESTVYRQVERSDTFGIENSVKASAAMRHMKPLDKERVIKMWNWIRANT